MAKHDIVLLNVTSSGFETNIGNNVARIKGDSDKVFTVQPSGSVNTLISVDSNNPSVTFNATITSSGHISSSFNSTASFGRVNVTRLVGDASQMTNTNEVGHVSSSKQLASRISGAFTAGFTLDGENRLISGSRTSTGSFTRVFSNIYVGDASDMHSVNEEGHFSSSAQMASNISGSFTSGFNYSGKISGSADSTGSFGRVNFSGQIAGNAAAVSINQAGFFSGSAQMASNISGSFNKGFTFDGKISGSATSTGSFARTVANTFIGDASQVTGVANALPANVISGSAQIASNISGSFNKGFVLQSKTVSISGSATSTGSFGRIIMGPTTGLTSSIADTSQLIIPGKPGLISSSAQIASNISGSFTKGMLMNNALISGSRLSTGSFSRVDGIVSISGNASQVTNVTLSPGVVSGSAQLASNISGAFQRGFEFTGLTRGEILTGSYAGVSGSAFAYAGNATTMSISSICGSDYDYRLYDQLQKGIKGIQTFDKGGVWITSTALPAARANQTTLGTIDAALIAAGYTSPAYINSTIKFDEIAYSDSANMIQARGGVAGAGTQNAAAVFAGQPATSPYRQHVGKTEHYNGETWSEQADRTDDSLNVGGFGTQNAAVAVGGNTSASPNYPNNTELWNGSAWSSGPDHNQGDKKIPGSAGAYNAGIIIGGGVSQYASCTHTETWDGTSWTTANNANQSAYGNSVAGSSNSAHSVGIHCQLNGGQHSQIFDGTSFTNGPNKSHGGVGFAGVNAAGLSSCHMYAGGSTSAPLAAHTTCTEIFTARSLTTASFSRLDFNSLGFATSIGIASSSLTGYESGHISGAAQLATSISGSFNKGFNFTGEITGSSASSLKIQSLNIGGTTGFANTKFTKNWDGTFVRSATFGNNLGTGISGSFNAGFNVYGNVSGSVSSTGSFSRIESKRLLTKGIAGERKLVSGSMDHDHYISGSFATKASKPINIPVRGKIINSVNTRQFTATGSMQDQKYRAQPGQLFVDNWGRLNMTIQTGSMVAVAGTWSTPYPSGLSGRFGGVASKSTTAGAGGQYNDWKQYDGLSIKAIPGGGAHNYGWTTGIQVVGDGIDDMITFGNGFPATTKTNVWNGSSWSLAQNAPTSTYSSVALTHGTQNDSGFIGGHYSGPHGQTLDLWNGLSWHDTGQALITGRYYGIGSGTTNAGLVTGGAESASPYPSSTCTEEWNGSTWATGGALGRAQHAGRAGGTQNATTHYGGYPNAYTEEYNGTAWSTGPDGPNSTLQAGGSGGAGNLMQNSGLYGAAGLHIFETSYVTGSADTYNNFSQNPSGRYLLTKRLQANYSPGTSGGVTSGSSDGYGGGY